MSTAVSSLRHIGDAIMRHRGATLAVMCVVAVVLRIVASALSGDAYRGISGDMISYHEFANAILGGDWWGRHVSYREPGYPIFLALVYKIGGSDPAAARVTNALLCAANCVVIYFLGKRLFTAAVGLAAAAWFALYFNSIHHATMLLRESLVTLLFTLTILLAVRAARSRRPWNAAAVAVVLVGLVHTDARFLFQVPFLLAYLLIAAGGWRQGVRAALVCTAVFVVGMLPWQVRNYGVYDRIVLVNPRTLVLPAPWRDYTNVPPAAGLEKPGPDTREGVRRLGPVREALYDFTEFYRVFRFRGEVRANSNAWEKPWSAAHNWSSILMYGTLIPFFLYGFWVIVRDKLFYAYVLVLPVLAHTILHVAKWGRDRYRLPIEPLLILAAFFAISLLIQRRAVGDKKGAPQ